MLTKIKWIAALTMMLDHLGVLYDSSILRIIGRFSFPLFCWLLVQGERNSSNWQNYWKRLIVFACISQIPYSFFRGELTLNILALFALVLPYIKAIRECKLPLWFWLVLATLAEILQLEYGFYGPMLLFFIQTCPNNNSPDFPSRYCLWLLGFMGIHYLYGLMAPLQLFALCFAAIFPFLKVPPTNYRRRANRWFYWFYPLHLGVLALIKMLFPITS